MLIETSIFKIWNSTRVCRILWSSFLLQTQCYKKGNDCNGFATCYDRSDEPESCDASKVTDQIEFTSSKFEDGKFKELQMLANGLMAMIDRDVCVK